MAEFDSGGLSAVSTFFGVDKKQAQSTSPAQQTALQNARGRHGVGSTSAKKQVTSSEDTIGRVLKVGKRKRPEDGDDDETASHESDNEHEEEGRTAIAEKSTTVPSDAAGTAETKQSKKKKKKGKKERQAEQAKDKLQAQDDDAAATEAHAEKDKDVAEENSRTKRKRHKVRSRQKNIYKDKRLAQHKPGHLIPGRAEFQGRPMTAETRAKLNLAPSKSSRHHHDDEDDANHNDQSESTGEGVKLAIDDLLDHDDETANVGDVVGATAVQADEIKKKKKKERKKPKYKNLQ